MVFFTLLLGLNSWTSAAVAESAADRATARSLAREGFDALKKGDFATAEDRFRRADELVHAPTLVVDHARALVGLGRLVEAHERYSLVIREGVAADAAGPWKRAHADAQQEIEDVKGRLAWLTVKVVGPEQPELSVDGKPIPSAAIGVRRATDPGDRQIVASAPGYLPKELSISLGEGEEQALEIELETDPNAVAADVEDSGPTQAVATEQAPPPSDGKDHTMLAYVAFGIGGVGLATGVTLPILQ
jgi:hypothetical protein